MTWHVLLQDGQRVCRSFSGEQSPSGPRPSRRPTALDPKQLQGEPWPAAGSFLPSSCLVSAEGLPCASCSDKYDPDLAVKLACLTRAALAGKRVSPWSACCGRQAVLAAWQVRQCYWTHTLAHNWEDCCHVHEPEAARRRNSDRYDYLPEYCKDLRRFHFCLLVCSLLDCSVA